MHLQADQTTAQPLRPEPGDSSLTLATLPARVRDIATLRGLGYSYREIAGHLRVSPQAVSIMLARHRRKLRSLAGAPSLHRLSARAVNALGRHGIADRKQAREARALDLLAREPNCGRKTLEEIAMWMESGE